MRRLSQEAVSVLGSMRVEGNSAFIQGQLDRKLYLEVNQSLEALGGKWNRKAKAHLFEGNPEDVLDQVVLTGGFTDAKQEFGFFETPPALADRVAGLADLAAGQHVLEPSAGMGRLVEAADRATPGLDVTMFEVQEKLARGLELRYPGRLVYFADFLSYGRNDAAVSGLRSVDRVVMNPPFARQQDIDHVARAFSLLRPGGRLVAVMSAGVTFRRNKKTGDFRDLVATARFSRFEPLLPNAFAESGTNVNACVLVLVKA